MRQGIYMGAITALQGERALLRNVEPIDHDRVLAQFDKLDLEHEGNNLAHGWHEFEQDDFLEYIEL